MKRLTIAILYHYVPKDIKDKYFSLEHALVDNQTDDIVHYMRRLFRRRRYTVQVIKVEPDNLSGLKKLKSDFVFNLVDSKKMELEIARILGCLHIPYSGSSFKTIQTTNNKLKTKKVFLKNQLPTPNFSIIRLSDRLRRGLIPGKFPVIVKPAFEHCSIGITDDSVVTTYEQFKKYIKNRWNIYGFDEKWSKHLPVYKNCHFVSPPKKLRNDIDTNIKRDSIRAFYALGLRDYARFDLRYNPTFRQWYFLEANADAGFDPDPRDAMTASIEAHGMTLDDFVLQIVRNSIH